MTYIEHHNSMFFHWKEVENGMNGASSGPRTASVR
jgi:hypothetical protein